MTTIALRRYGSAYVETVMPVMPSDTPAPIRDGLNRRVLVGLTGACPCGATMPPPPSRAARREAARTGVPMRVTVEHEDGCAAIEGHLAPAIRRWMTP